jgi:hypothetical protein
VKCASDSAFYKEAETAFVDALNDHPNKPASYVRTLFFVSSFKSSFLFSQY